MIRIYRIIEFKEYMKITVVALFCIFSSFFSRAQSTNDIMVGGGVDLFKTDNRRLFDKGQVGLEANYFVVRHFAVGAGIELWSGSSNSFVMGMRWYADDNFFVRLRTLVGANKAALGIGWSKPILKDWRAEAMGDFYLGGNFNTEPSFALRAGVAYILH
jgi:hypothetical protein